MGKRNQKSAKSLAIIAALLIGATLSGQVNTESMRRKAEKPISGEISLTYSITAGNSQLISYGIAPGFAWKKNRHHLFMLNNYQQVKSGDNSIINKGFSHLRYNMEALPRLVGEFFGQIEYNRAQLLDRRFLIGAGIRIPFDGENFSQAIGFTPMWEYEDADTLGISKIIRLSSYWSLRWNSETVNFSNTLYAQPDVKNVSDLRLLAEGKITVKWTKSLSFSTSWRYRYDSEPLTTLKNYDMELKNGLEFQF
jgi:hypothetical protein